MDDFWVEILQKYGYNIVKETNGFRLRFTMYAKETLYFETIVLHNVYNKHCILRQIPFTM